MTTCQLSVSDHTTSAPVAVGLSQPTRRSSVLAHHTGRYQRSSAQSFRRFIGLRCVSCNIAELAAFWSPFRKETVCEKFQIAREKVVVTVTTTFKSGSDMSPPSHTKLRLCSKMIGNFKTKCYVYSSFVFTSSCQIKFH